MRQALQIERTEDNKFRAIIWSMDDDGVRSIENIAETENLANLNLWFDANYGRTCHYVRLNDRDANWDMPDALTVFEAAEAAAYPLCG